MIRGFGRLLGRLLAISVLVVAALWLFGPYEKIDLDASFDPQKLDNGVQAYFESVRIADFRHHAGHPKAGDLATRI